MALSYSGTESGAKHCALCGRKFASRHRVCLLVTSYAYDLPTTCIDPVLVYSVLCTKCFKETIEKIMGAPEPVDEDYYPYYAI